MGSLFPSHTLGLRMNQLNKLLKPRQRRQSPGTDISSLLTAQPCAQPAAGSSRLGFAGLLLSACSYSNPHTALPVSPRCPHRFCQPLAALKGRECPGAEVGEREMCRAELWLLSPPRSGEDLGGHPADDRSSGNDLFQGTLGTGCRIPMAMKKGIQQNDLSYHRLKRTHFPCGTNSKKAYCPSLWVCNTEGVLAKHVLVAHVQPPRWLQRIHPERKKKIPKNNSKTSCANKALMSLEFETEDMHKIVLPAVPAQQFTDQEGGG